MEDTLERPLASDTDLDGDTAFLGGSRQRVANRRLFVQLDVTPNPRKPLQTQRFLRFRNS